MKKIFFMILIIILCINLFSEEKLDSLKFDKSEYGFKIKPNYYLEKNNYNDFINFQNDFLTEIQQIREKKKKINLLNKYLPKMNYNTLEGIFIRDSILMYIYEEFDSELIKLLVKYNKKNKINKKIIQDIIDIKENKNLKNLSPFCFSTMIQYLKLNYDVLIFLPNTDWQGFTVKDKEENPSKEEDTGIYMAGGDYYSATINVHKEVIESNYDIINDIKRKREYPVIKSIDDNGVSIYSLKSNEIVLIEENIKIGDIHFDKIYECITVSPFKYNAMIHARRTRFYISQNHLYTISVASTIVGFHMLSDRYYLTKLHGLILDTVTF